MTATLIIILIVVLASVFAVASQVLIDRLIEPAQLASAQQTVGDLIIQPVAGLYGVLVAFLLAGALSNYQDLRRGVANEANALIDLTQIANLLPPPTGYEIRAAALAYTRSVITDEWPRMAEGGSSSQTTLALADLWRSIATYSPPSAGDANLHALALDLTQTIALQRQLRILAASRTIPALIWVILGFGGIVTILLSTFSAHPPRRLRYTFVAAMAVIIALSLYTLFVLSHPFESAIPLISPERLQSVQEFLTTSP
jgi:hypothetical protein